MDAPYFANIKNMKLILNMILFFYITRMRLLQWLCVRIEASRMFLF